VPDHPIGPYRHVVLAFISSQVPSTPNPTDLVLDPKDTDFAATGLRVASALRLHRMMTVTTNLIHRELGELSSRMQLQVAERLVRLFQLPGQKPPAPGP
jgi:mRNA interferase MazF